MYQYTYIDTSKERVQGQRLTGQSDIDLNLPVTLQLLQPTPIIQQKKQNYLFIVLIKTI